MLEQLYSRPTTITQLHTGPLGAYIDGFAERFSKEGYSSSTLRAKIRVVDMLGKWLTIKRIDLAALDEGRVEEFLESRRRRGFVTGTVSAASKQLLSYLRAVGAVPAATLLDSDTLPSVEKEYAEYLARERGNTAPTIRYQLLIARRFLAERFGLGTIEYSQLCAADVTQFTLRHAYAFKRRTSQTMLSSLRSFLRFLYIRGETPNDLTGCVFKVADWHLAGLPNYLEPKQVELLLQGVDRMTPSGRRDYAILLLLARLGLRACEVVNLGLEDIDWEAGTITIQGKSNHHNCLPLPQDVGEAIVEYLRRGRPECSSRKVFVRAVAPNRELTSSSAITCIVKRYLLQASLHPARMGAHVLRHSLATRMIRGGNTLDEIGDILGHQFRTSTEIYAKVAITSLRKLARPWPGVKQ